MYVRIKKNSGSGESENISFIDFNSNEMMRIFFELMYKV